MEYVISWETTETVRHVATVDADTMAGMLGIGSEELTACGYDSAAVRALDGTRDLSDGLADVEDSDTEDPDHDAYTEREVRIVHVK